MINTNVDFGKATTSEIAQEVFEEIIKKYILCDGPIDVEAVKNEINEFKNVIIESIRRGERTFLPNGNAKELEAYKDPGTNQSVRGALTWNLLYPDNMIEFPSKVNLIKLNILKESDIDDLKYEEPEIYNTIIDKIFNDNTGIFVNKKVTTINYVNVKDKEWYKNVPKKYRSKYKKLGPAAWNDFVDTLDDETKDSFSDDSETKVKGMQIIAIPKSINNIPAWLDKYIDYNTMVNNILSPFNPMLDIIGIQTIDEGKLKNGVNRKTKAVSNIIKF